MCIKIYYSFYIPTLTEGETNTRNILMVGAGAYWDQGETWWQENSLESHKDDPSYDF